MDSYTKEHSAEYQSQALIDLAFRMREQIADTRKIEKIVIHTSHHTHYVIGTGANDPQKMDPKASRETLDHSIMYIFAVALQDGTWHHVDSYAPTRARRKDTVELWHKIETQEDEAWTRRYHSRDPNELAFGARIEITMKDGQVITDEMAIANAHPLGATPWGRDDYIGKFNVMTEGLITPKESARFLQAAQELPELPAGELHRLNVAMPADASWRPSPAFSEPSLGKLGLCMRGLWPFQPRIEGPPCQKPHVDRSQEIRRPVRRHRREHRAVHRGAHRQRPALPRLRHPGDRRDLRVRGDRPPAGARHAADRGRSCAATRPSCARCAACPPACAPCWRRCRPHAPDGRDAHRRVGAGLRAAGAGRPQPAWRP